MTRDEEVRNAIDTIIPIFPSNNGRTYEQALMASGFEAGVKWADANPKSPWISVEEDLPCNHDSMICEVCKGVDYETNRVLVLLIDGTIEISYMYRWMPHAWRWNTYKVTHWFPLPELPK